MYCYIKMVLRFWLGGVLLAAFPSYAEDKLLVHVDQVQPWHDGIQKSLYCHGDVPFRPQVSSHVKAQLDWVLPVNMPVKKGDVIALQDDFYLVQESLKLTAKLEAAKAQADFSAQEYQRIQSLDKQEMVSVSDLNRAKLDAKLTKQQYLALKADQMILEHQIANLKHLAPADGQIFTLNAQPGEWLDSGDSILSFLPSDNQEVICQMSLDLFQEINDIELANFQLKSGETLVFNRLASKVDEAAQTVNVHFNFKNETAALFLNERIAVNMQMPMKALTLITYDALNLKDNEYYVWLLNDANKVTQVPVQIMDTQGAHAVVQSNIKVGEHVVVRGGKSLSLNDQVIVANADEVKVRL
ncbi:efflux RND transporter periplasmic adaptor subunit [uncultured Shewanella sp.]|uniref:efflux RND transporter periplasmic adaptor subunit n=1 Tax=uncultured Shewanella sp. TaxID=173975 RepID=UPI002606AC93|nr:efflux RND transporter periplasmic adaptor subunit [uncultured Shewanella sp.]